MSKRRDRGLKGGGSKANDNRPSMPDLATIDKLPLSHQEIESFVAQYNDFDLYALRVETMKRIEKITNNRLLCYVTQTSFLPNELPPYITSIEDSDIEGFDSLIDTAVSSSDDSSNGRNIDILFVSNGGSAEAAERIVRLLRENFDQVRFILPANAFSAATMMSFACDSVLMTDSATLGPIDPQVGGIPTRTILRGFEDLERRMKEEGPEALTAYIDLLKNYSLHLLEICKSAEELAKELAINWLSKCMLKCPQDDPKVETVVKYFANYDKHKSHGRSIGRQQAIDLGLAIEKLERGTSLDKLVRGLNAQYSLFLTRTDFWKIYENAYGTGWGRRWPPISQAMIEKIGANPLHYQ